jgi:tetratricopeptide (TPR) repeat protein
VASGSLTQTIASLQSRLTAVPADWSSWATLGLAYVQQARVTADPTYYPKAEAVLNRSLRIHAHGNLPALTGLAALALARHDFSGALDLGRRAVALDDFNANAHGVMGDALVELGRYDEAFVQIQRMVDLRPDLSSYARVSYARELQGDVVGARRDMRLALDAAASFADRAWALNQLGDLAFTVGDLRAAAGDYRKAMAADPSFVPAQAGVAKVAAAQGDVPGAIRSYRHIVEVYPLPQYVVDLGDLLTVSGDPAGAARQYELLRVEAQLFRANGVDMDLEVAQFDAEHVVRTDEGLAAARAEFARRQSVTVADALAWALHAAGHDAEALGYANRSLSLGTRSALFLFHRGMIEKALGRMAAARRDLAAAIDLNPHFSILWGPRAARALASLGGRP